jgi:HEAT repeat protein
MVRIRQARLMSLFNIEQGEDRLVVLVLAFAILLYSANVLARAASYGLFLAEFDAGTLPFAYVGVAIFATLASMAYLKLSDRMELSTVLLLCLGFILLTLAGYWLSLTVSDARWLRFSLPIYFGVENALTITVFWNLLGRIFNLQQGKRLFGLLSSGEHIATLVIGLLAPILVLWIGSTNLFLLAALFMVATLFLLIAIRRQFGALLTASDGESRPKAEKPTGRALASRYILLIMALFGLFVVGVYFVDNIFYTEAESRFLTEDALTSFVGVFFGIVGGLSLFVQLFIAGRLISRFGVKIAILITPVILLTTTMAYAFFGTFTAMVTLLFWIAIIANLFRLILDATDSAAVNLLYQPLPADQRTTVQTTVSGMLYPISIGVAGLALLVLIQVLGFDSVQLSYVLFFILIVWLVVAVLLGREYPRRLRQALKHRQLGHMEAPLPERSSVDILDQALDSLRPGVVVYAMDNLEQIDPDKLARSLPHLLEHPNEEVRVETLRSIERSQVNEALPAVRERVTIDESERVRGASVRVLAMMADSDELTTIYAYLEAPEVEIKKGAAVGLMRSGDIEGMMIAGERLTAWVNAPKPVERAFAAEVLGEARIRTLYRPLLKLLEDPSPMVQRAALEAAGKVGNTNIWPAVAHCLSSPHIRAAAARALSAGGESALPAIRATAAGVDHSSETLRYVAHLCGRIGGEAAVEILLKQLDYPDVSVRYSVLRALNRCRYLAGDRRTIEQRISMEVSQAAWSMGAWEILGSDDLPDEEAQQAVDLLRDALWQSTLHNRSCIFLWLSFIYDRQLLAEISANLSSEGDQRLARERRAYAQELVELNVDTSLKGTVKPLLVAQSPEDMLRHLSSQIRPEPVSVAQRLQAIANGPGSWISPWLKACSLYTAGRLGNTKLDETMVKNLSASDPLVQETALKVLADWLQGKEDQLDKVVGPDQIDIIKKAVARSGSAQGEQKMLSTVEKVIALKSVDIFSYVPDDVLAEIASILEERRFVAGDSIIKKGELGSSMYTIVSGRVRVHDEHSQFNMLEEGDVFGEMALLDTAPRSASVTAIEDTLLLRLEQDLFYELLEDQGYVSRGIMQLLTRRMRGLMGEGHADETLSSQQAR